MASRGPQDAPTLCLIVNYMPHWSIWKIGKSGLRGHYIRPGYILLKLLSELISGPNNTEEKNKPPNRHARTQGLPLMCNLCITAAWWGPDGKNKDNNNNLLKTCSQDVLNSARLAPTRNTIVTLPLALKRIFNEQHYSSSSMKIRPHYPLKNVMKICL